MNIEVNLKFYTKLFIGLGWQVKIENQNHRNEPQIKIYVCRMEHQANLLWINSDSSYNIHEQWLQQHFKKNERPQVLIVKSENILTPENIQKVS